MGLKGVLGQMKADSNCCYVEVLRRREGKLLASSSTPSYDKERGDHPITPAQD